MNSRPELSAVTVQYQAIRLETLKITYADETLLSYLNVSGAQQQDYLQTEQNESVDQGNFEYHFRGTELLGRLELDDTSTNSNGDRLSTVTGTEFLHDMFNVDLDGFF